MASLVARLLVPIALLALACAHAPRPAPPPPPPPPLDCEAVRDRTIRACVEGYWANVGEVDPDGLEFQFAILDACPYAGAVAWSGCYRGAFESFAGRSPLGRCGDEADYVESSILTSCMHPRELPRA